MITSIIETSTSASAFSTENKINAFQGFEQHLQQRFFFKIITVEDTLN